jgi:hypothetical protein
VKITLYITDELPEVAAAILRERALLRHEGKVYVKPHTRSWPKGIMAARRAERKAKSHDQLAGLRAARGKR